VVSDTNGLGITEWLITKDKGRRRPNASFSRSPDNQQGWETISAKTIANRALLQRKEASCVVMRILGLTGGRGSEGMVKMPKGGGVVSGL